jgi:tetratricopeptide (TPR) repeat protein
MSISMIAMNRMLEDTINEGIIRREALVNNKRTVLSDIRRLDDSMIIDRLNALGVDIDRALFYESIKRHPSSEEYFIWLMDEKKLKLKEMDEDKLWMCLTVLWERWFPEVPNFEMVDDKIYSGYMRLEEGKTVEACSLWWDAWNNIIYLMDHHEVSGIDEFDKKFRGTQSVSNWTSDFEMELHNAGSCDKSYFEKRIEFCSEYLVKSGSKHQLDIENMRRAIAEAYSSLGRQNESDALFESYLKEDPKWGWGWIGWSDCYWILRGEEHNDYEKAETILKKALSVEGLRDRADVMERLMNLYEDSGREEEANKIERELKKLEKNRYSMKNNIQAITSIKFGRNDPCPCGSGKKYKKCCG